MAKSPAGITRKTTSPGMKYKKTSASTTKAVERLLERFTSFEKKKNVGYTLLTFFKQIKI